jgi:hypothetical protein
MGSTMVGVVTSYHHRRFAYEKQRHHQSRSSRRCSGHGRRRRRHCRRRRRAKFHDKRNHSVHQCYGDDTIHDHNAVEHHHDTVDDDAEDTDAAAGIQRSPVPEHGQQVRVIRLQLWLELGLGL